MQRKSVVMPVAIQRHVFLLLCCVVAISTGCVGTPFSQQKLTACFDTEQLEFRDEVSGISHQVYCMGKDKSPPLLLLHEITGVSPATLEYAETLSSDFTVYVPHLVGPFNWSHSFLGAERAFVRGWFESTFSGEWSGLENGNSKVAAWLRHLTAQISTYHEGLPISVIGNCLTGTLPLTLFANPGVNIHAVVIAQPALPRSFANLHISSEDRKHIGVASQDIENAKTSGVRIYGIRFEYDETSPSEKFERLRCEFKDRFINAEIDHTEYLNQSSFSPDTDRDAHSTLIGEFQTKGAVGDAVRRRRCEVKEFLKNPTDFRRQSSNCPGEVRTEYIKECSHRP